jgi:hypothetical protein
MVGTIFLVQFHWKHKVDSEFVLLTNRVLVTSQMDP